jgi:hypothetical protein
MGPKRVYPSVIYGRPKIIFGEVLRTPSFVFGECEIGPGMSKIKPVHHITSICLAPVQIYACRRSGGLQLTAQVYCQAGKSSDNDFPNDVRTSRVVPTAGHIEKSLLRVER